MLRGEEIKILVDLLHARGVTLWHACQYMDFCSYVKLGGIPSRRLLEESGERFTKFDTDGDDRINGVWHRVFVNPEDHGYYFASGKSWTPNPYGPIQIQILPSVLHRANEVAWTRRSAGARDFDLDSECIDDIEKINRLFMCADLRSPMDERSRLNTTVKIRQILCYDRAGRPEINCQMDDEKIPVRYWLDVRVDRYNIFDKNLKSVVDTVLKYHNINKRALNRNTNLERRAILGEMVDWIVDGAMEIQEMLAMPEISPDLKDYLTRIVESNLEYQFNRWAKYLYGGTLQPLRGQREYGAGGIGSG